MRLVCADVPLLEELARQPKVRDYLGERLDATSFLVDPAHRGVLKQALIAVGYPAEDLAGYTEGAALPMQSARRWPAPACRFTVRDYQREAADIFYAGGDVRGGSGVIVLPCGAGKTIVGIAAMALMQTLDAGPDHQHHRRQAVDPRDPRQDRSRRGTDRPSTPARSRTSPPSPLATYQILTHRNDKNEEFPHFKLFDQRDWGLIIYDEVHLLPAPVFRVTAQIQARRRLGLTATLIREDGREEDVFSLIGPKKYDVPWRELESRGWIAEASCTEVRVALPEATAHGIRRGRVAQQVPHRQREPRQGRRRRPPAGAVPGQPGADHRPVSEAAPRTCRSASTFRSSPARRPTRNARSSTASSAAARCGS